MHIGIIYKIANNVDGGAYVGSTRYTVQRFRQHYRHLRLGRHHCKSLQIAWDNYGEERFLIEPVETVTADTLEDLDTRLIAAECRILDACLGETYNTVRPASRGRPFDVVGGVSVGPVQLIERPIESRYWRRMDGVRLKPKRQPRDTRESDAPQGVLHGPRETRWMPYTHRSSPQRGDAELQSYSTKRWGPLTYVADGDR